jgi:hypothetical protein
MDAVEYLKKAAEGRSVCYTKLTHVTCVANAFHRVSETIRVLYPNVYKLVANGKKLFVNLPARREFFKNKVAETPFPPIPVITRRRTSVDYTDKFEIFCSVANELHRDHASSTAILQQLINVSNEVRMLKLTWPTCIQISYACRFIYPQICCRKEQ